MNPFHARLFGGSILRAPSDEGGGSAPAAEPVAAAAPEPAAAAPAAAAEPAARSEPDTGPLTIADAVKRLLPESERAPREAAADDEGHEDRADTSSADGEDGAGETSPTADVEGEGEPAKPAIEPPKFWSAEDKAAFAELTPDMQERVVRYAKAGDTAAAKALEEAATVRKTAEQDASGIGKLKADLDKLVPAAKAKFEQTWPTDIDWVAVQEKYGSEEAVRLKFAHDQDKAELARLETAQKQAEATEYRTFVQREFERLKTVAPDLVDPKLGDQRRAAVAQFLLKRGVSAAQISRAGADEFALAYDAMLHSQAKASLKTPQPKPNTPPAPGRPAVTPAAAQTPRSPQQRSSSEAKNRFVQKPTVKNAAAAILARGG